MRAAILIDLDDTLVDDRYAMSRAIAELQQSEQFCCALTTDALVDQWVSVTELHWARYRAGELTFQEQRRERLRSILQRPVAATEADELFAQYLQHYQRNWCLALGALEFLERTASVPKALVTNGEHKQVNSKVSALGLERHFAVVVTPEVAGASKPDSAIFIHALRSLGGIEARECLMVGDSIEADIKPAQALGMKTFHVCNRTPGRTVADAANAI